MKQNTPTVKNIPLDIVGSSTFGRDPKILASRTFNMITADNWFIDYGGYENVSSVNPDGTGRGIFTSVRANKLIVVMGNSVYSVSVYNIEENNKRQYSIQFVGQIDTFYGDVFLDENNANQIAICDQNAIYIYNYVLSTFIKATLPLGFIPGYVTFQDGFFIAPDRNSSLWILSAANDGLNWFWGAAGAPVEGSIQTKPDLGVAALRVPGRGNLLYVFGQTVTEPWTDIGAPIFPYQKSSSINFDYGLVNSATLAASDEIVAWLGQNEKSGPVIMYTMGNEVHQISTDGYNYKFEQLNFPEKSSAFFVKLSGHLIYQLTFYDPSDNFSLIYDFTSGKFYDVTDENMNFHIARRVAFFQDEYYFVSFNDGNLYQMRADLTTFNYGIREYEIPRIRVCSNIRLPNQFRFAVNNVTFTLEQGNDADAVFDYDPNYNPRIAMSISKDGGYRFSSYSSRPVYRTARRINRLNWWNVCSANDFIPQFRFWGRGPWKATDGIVSIYQ